MRNTVVEDMTANRLREYERKTKQSLCLPVPVDKVVEQVLDLRLDYDEIEEKTGECILGALDIQNRTILLNTKHLALFEQKPGLERSTIGHEAGHWDMDIDRAAVLHPTLPGFTNSSHVVHRHAKKGNRFIEVLVKRALTDPKAAKLYRELTASEDSPEVKSLVDRYQSALLMPAWLIREAAERYDVTNWSELRVLAAEAKVNISNLTTRLRRLGLIFIPEGSTTIYRNQDEFTGQGTLF